MEMSSVVDEWRAAALPPVAVDGWTPESARAGLVEIARLRGQLDAAQAMLVGVLAAETGRDTRATLARQFKMSATEAAKATAVADVVGRVPGAAAALARGEVTGEHLRRLAPVADVAAAVSLLEVAAGESPDAFARRVDRYRIGADANGWRERQRAATGVWFFEAEHGCGGMRAVLPRLACERIRSVLNAVVDDQWRAAHPERAAVLGGHHEEPRERRLADALVAVVEGDAGAGARVGVVVTVRAETLEANLLGVGPVSLDDVVDVIGQARTELYAAIQATDGAILRFGRNRRYATALQKLALAVRDDGSCTWDACTQPWDRCDAHHDPPWEQGGRTDLECLRLLCRCSHHPHLHEVEGALALASP